MASSLIRLLFGNVVQRIYQFLRFHKAPALLVGKAWFLLFAILFISVQLYLSNKSAHRRTLVKHSVFWKVDERILLYSALLEAEVKVFLVDPSLLIPLVPPTATQQISKDPAVKQLFSKDFKEPPSSFLVGLLINCSSNLTSIIEAISGVARRRNAEVVLCDYDDVPREFKISGPSKPTVGRIFLVSKDGFKLQIIVFHTVLDSTFYWSSGLSTDCQFQDPTYDPGVPLGTHSTLFDRFDLQSEALEFNRTKLRVLVPDDVPSFLQQVPHSTFKGCNRDYADFFKQKYNTSAEDQKRSDTNSRLTLVAVKRILNETLVPFWICCGTLLGWYRQCGTIPYTVDLDLCTHASFASDTLETKVLELAAPSGLFVHMARYGFPEAGLELALLTKKGGTRVDLFFVYPATIEWPELEGWDDLPWIIYLHRIGDAACAYQFYRIPPITSLCSTNLLGLKVLVPCDPMPSLLNDYGPDWGFPAKDYSYYYGDLSGLRYWSKAQGPLAFAVHDIEPSSPTSTTEMLNGSQPFNS